MAEHSIVDTPWSAAARAAGIKAAGVDAVIRYYNFSNSRALPEKCLTLAEAQTLCAAGLRLAVVFQQRQNQQSDFSKAQGLRAGRRAYALARDHIGQPPGSGIYFAVDFDAGNRELDEAVIPFFEGVAEAFETESGGERSYRIGCYGSGLLARALESRGLAELYWISMSRGFRETRERLQQGNWHLNQVPPADSLLGLGIDYNDANPDGRDFGAFTVPDDDTVPPAAAGVPVADDPARSRRHRVNARTGLRLRSGPGTEFDITGSLALGSVVHVLTRIGDWALVDLNGDGAVDGFAHAAFLEPF